MLRNGSVIILSHEKAKRMTGNNSRSQNAITMFYNAPTIQNDLFNCFAVDLSEAVIALTNTRDGEKLISEITETKKNYDVARQKPLVILSHYERVEYLKKINYPAELTDINIITRMIGKQLGIEEKDESKIFPITKIENFYEFCDPLYNIRYFHGSQLYSEFEKSSKLLNYINFKGQSAPNETLEFLKNSFTKFLASSPWNKYVFF